MNKIDLPLLSSDIKKYRKAEVFNDKTYKEWDQFLNGFKNTYAKLPLNPPQWPIDSLPASESPRDARVEISDNITSVHQSEIEPIQPVNQK